MNAAEKDRARQAYREHMKDARAAFAPGRIEFLGNHLDYNGGPVLGLSIDAGVYALAIPRKEESLRLFSENFENAPVETTLHDVSFRQGPESWANYPLGVLWALQEIGCAPEVGFELILTTDLPLSAGLSSSAAVELATALALLQLAGKSLSKLDLARLCRRAENEFVGLPCGLLDQGVSAHGEPDQLVHLDCRRETFSLLPLPPRSSWWIFDTGIKHDLVDSKYAERHAECSAAYEKLKTLSPELLCLSQVTIELLEQTELSDTEEKRVRHVIEETARVKEAKALLGQGGSASQIGHLLFASHRSSSKLFENSCSELDFLVNDLETRPGVHGARLTGGGFGGAVLVWANEEFSVKQAQEANAAYQAAFGTAPTCRRFKVGAGAHFRDPLK